MLILPSDVDPRIFCSALTGFPRVLIVRLSGRYIVISRMIDVLIVPATNSTVTEI